MEQSSVKPFFRELPFTFENFGEKSLVCISVTAWLLNEAGLTVVSNAE